MKNVFGLRSFSQSAFFGALVLFTYVFVVNAWVVDDAYITFRTVDNFVHGYGLTWNTDERVQAYSHPLWMLLFSIFYYFTSEPFYTSIALSFALCVATLLVAYRFFLRRGDPWKAALLIVLLIGSKAFVDYTSSGLENALSYLLAMLFFAKVLEKPAPALSVDDIAGPFLIAALAFVNRQDTVLLYLPWLTYLLIVHLPKMGLRLVGRILVAVVPAVMWLSFSVFYYGTPLPNPSYAKLLNTGIPLADRLRRGFQYWGNSLRWDVGSHLVVAAAIVLAVRRGSKEALLACAGLALYVTFVLTSAASATHMSGRFFALPFFVAFLLFVDSVDAKPWPAVVLAAALAYQAWHPLAPLKMWTRLYVVQPQNDDAIDTNWFVHREGAALANYFERPNLPDHAWLHAGERFRREPERVRVGGAGEAIGYFGYAAGPGKHIIDFVGLGDALLARLPACNTARFEYWKSGHFYRIPPGGYVESVIESKNLIADPSLHAYYDKIMNVTRGPLLSAARLADIYGLLSGKYDSLTEPYRRRVAAEYSTRDCREAVRAGATLVTDEAAVSP